MISLFVGLSTPYKYVSKATHPDFTKFSVHVTYLCLQCFDAVGWAAGRASGL